MIESRTKASVGDLVQLVSSTKKSYIFRLKPSHDLQTHRGVIKHDDLIGIPWGSQVYSHIGSPHYLLQPSLADLLREIKRNTQIIYPKDMGFILVTMNIGPGAIVVEAGSGSGSLTTALAWAVGPEGNVISYEVRPEMHNLAKKNLTRIGLEQRVTFKLRDIAAGFDEQNVDALFLDVPYPQDYMAQVRKTLKPGGHFGSILPTTNQVTELLTAMHRHDFEFVDVCEIILRYYKPVPTRLRPTDRMVAHTGFLVFGRPIIPDDEHSTVNDGGNLVENESHSDQETMDDLATK
jgi:tRNA (adenine57-N1/adenine58-N1)-methyltransferase